MIYDDNFARLYPMTKAPRFSVQMDRHPLLLHSWKTNAVIKDLLRHLCMDGQRMLLEIVFPAFKVNTKLHRESVHPISWKMSEGSLITTRDNVHFI